MAARAFRHTTKLYDRGAQVTSLDEVERIILYSFQSTGRTRPSGSTVRWLPLANVI